LRRIARGKNHHRTAASNDADPVWNELFFIELADNEPLKFEIQSKVRMAFTSTLP